MSELGHKPKWCHVRFMSVLPLKADIHKRGLHVRIRAPKGFVRLVPVAEVGIGAGYISRSGSEITASLLPF